MKNKLCVLVLGVGGNIGQGILKALSICDIPHRVIGACVNPLGVGLYTTDRSYLSPYHDDPHFLTWLLTVCEDEKVDVILTGVEPVLFFLANHADEIRDKTGSIVVTSEPEKLLIANDKYKTCQWLKNQGFPFPRFALSDDLSATAALIAACGWRLIAKPRFGRGGNGVFHIQDESALIFVQSQRDYLIQEYIGDETSEYTVGCFNDQQGKCGGVIVMKRELLEGTTYRAEVGVFPDIRDAAERIVTALQPKGPCNLQMRLTKEGVPICFEMNMRFSGTTPLRARFGFNEVKAALALFALGKKEIDLPLITQGIALRYWNEVYINQHAHAELSSTGKLRDPQQFNLLFERYGQP